MKFTALGLNEATMKGINDAQFTDCTPVQELVLPYSLAGKDVMVQSKTGSGKTAVYVITIIEKYMKAYLSKSNLPVALVVAPTRELALQIESDAAELAKMNAEGKITGCVVEGPYDLYISLSEKKAAEKQAQKLAKLTPEQKQKRDARRLAQEKKDEARWQEEKAGH